MNPLEWRATLALTSVSVLRMLGMFMILPVFALYAGQLPGGASALQIGLAIGLFGLVQALLQIPFGIASDRYGRRPVVVIGVLLFAVGSFVAGHSQSIHWIMVGRALQGAGAVSAAVAAWLSDATRIEVRTQAMAIHGAGVGISFVLALVLGPLLGGWIGVDGIFVVTGALALLSVPLLMFAVRDDARPHTRLDATTSVDAGSWLDRRLLPLNGGVLLLNAMLTALFAATPFAIVDTLALPSVAHWKFYLPVLIVALLPVFPLLRVSRMPHRRRPLFVGAVLLLGGSLTLAAFAHSTAAGLIIGVLLFFVAFSYLQASMPAIVSRLAPAHSRGAAMGVFNTAQVFGAAIGNLLGGFARGHWGIGGAFAGAAMLSLIWLLFVNATLLPDD
jgi:MFS family permease